MDFVNKHYNKILISGVFTLVGLIGSTLLWMAFGFEALLFFSLYFTAYPMLIVLIATMFVLIIERISGK